MPRPSGSGEENRSAHPERERHMDYIPHTQDDTAQMMRTIGIDAMEALFADIPEKMVWGVRRAMESGNMKELSEAVGEVEGFNAELGRQLRELASNFDFGRILELIGTGETDESLLS